MLLVFNLLINIHYFRYNANNLPTFERYVELQVTENLYDLEANLGKSSFCARNTSVFDRPNLFNLAIGILKLYQFFPQLYKPEVVCWILLKAITNLPHTDFVLCRCLLSSGQVCSLPIAPLSFSRNSAFIYRYFARLKTSM